MYNQVSLPRIENVEKENVTTMPLSPKRIKTQKPMQWISNENGTKGVNVANETFESEMANFPGSSRNMDSKMKTKPNLPNDVLEANTNITPLSDSNNQRTVCNYCGESIKRYV